jgi:hypothetical protein
VMAMSHSSCPHPATPAARAACRKARGQQTVSGRISDDAFRDPPIQSITPENDAKPATWTVTPRKTKRARSEPTLDLKRPGTYLRTIGDLPDVPRMLAHGARIAWSRDWGVKVGHPFNDRESRLVVEGLNGEISLVWKVTLPHGVWGIFYRQYGNSITHRINDIETAFRIAADEEELMNGVWKDR